jgi:heterodisulfide reductase subunit B
MEMDHLMRVLGAETADWSFKTECCGGSLGVVDVGQCLTLIRKIFDNALAVGADALVTACPMCHANLDGRQSSLAALAGHRYRMPVFYFSQLLALAMGLGARRAALDGHLVDVRPLLKERGLLM